MIADVTDQEPTVGGKNDAVRSEELCLGGGSAIAAESSGTGAGHGRNDAGRCIDPSNDVIVPLDDIQMPLFVELDLVRHVQRRRRRRAAITGIGRHPVSCDRGGLAGHQVEADGSAGCRDRRNRWHHPVRRRHRRGWRPDRRHNQARRSRSGSRHWTARSPARSREPQRHRPDPRRISALLS